MEGISRSVPEAIQFVANLPFPELARDTLPTLAMGTAPLVNGLARNILMYGGNAGQVVAAAWESYTEFRETHNAGAYANTAKRWAIGLRLVSGGANTISNFVEEPAHSVLSGVGTYTGALATGIDVTRHASESARRPLDPGGEMYLQRYNPVIGSGPGQIQPGQIPQALDSPVGSERGSVISMQPQSPTTAPAGGGGGGVRPVEQHQSSASYDGRRRGFVQQVGSGPRPRGRAAFVRQIEDQGQGQGQGPGIEVA
ncbi:hypothetical protein L1885_00925 [Streptomyces fuscigenes]|nr:hypothetical protein [Streptomyces fuscigenes]